MLSRRRCAAHSHRVTAAGDADFAPQLPNGSAIADEATDASFAAEDAEVAEVEKEAAAEIAALTDATADAPAGANVTAREEQVRALIEEVRWRAALLLSEPHRRRANGRREPDGTRTGVCLPQVRKVTAQVGPRGALDRASVGQSEPCGRSAARQSCRSCS